MYDPLAGFNYRSGRAQDAIWSVGKLAFPADVTVLAAVCLARRRRMDASLGFVTNRALARHFPYVHLPYPRALPAGTDTRKTPGGGGGGYSICRSRQFAGFDK